MGCINSVGGRNDDDDSDDDAGSSGEDHGAMTEQQRPTEPTTIADRAAAERLYTEHMQQRASSLQVCALAAGIVRCTAAV